MTRGAAGAPAGAGRDPASPATFRARSGLAAHDLATFHGAPPVHGPPMRSDFGYAAMFQARLRRVPEVEVAGSGDLVLFMVVTARHAMDVWMDGRHRGRTAFRCGDLVAVPPGMSGRWCARDGQAGAIHLHVSAGRLAPTLAEEPRLTALPLAPGLAFRDAVLARLLAKAARLDDADPLARLQVAALGALALLRVLRHPPPGLAAV